MKYLLSIDGSSPKTCILLLRESEILAFQECLGLSSEKIASLVNTMLEEAGISARDLTALRSGIGPGSYTGVRSALSFAGALAYALDIEILGFCALGALAPREEGTWPVAIDARSAGIWGALATWKEGKLCIKDPERIPSEEIFEWSRPYGGIWSIESAKLKAKSPQITAHESSINQLSLKDLSLYADKPLKPNYLGKGHNKPGS